MFNYKNGKRTTWRSKIKELQGGFTRLLTPYILAARLKLRKIKRERPQHVSLPLKKDNLLKGHLAKPLVDENNAKTDPPHASGIMGHGIDITTKLRPLFERFQRDHSTFHGPIREPVTSWRTDWTIMINPNMALIVLDTSIFAMNVPTDDQTADMLIKIYSVLAVTNLRRVSVTAFLASTIYKCPGTAREPDDFDLIEIKIQRN